MKYDWKFFACLFIVLVVAIVAASAISNYFQEKRLINLLSEEAPATETKSIY